MSVVANLPEPADRLSWDNGGAHANMAHSVQFYEEESVFLEGLGEFLGSVLGSGGACIVIGTEPHRNALIAWLTTHGFDLTRAMRDDRYLPLDAAATLAEFMVDDWPDADRFSAVLEPVLLKAADARGRTGSLAAFGEMVALLAAKGNIEAASRLEQLWNELSSRYSFELRCAYPLTSFRTESDLAAFRVICNEHGHVVPAESFSSLATEGERMRMVGVLQQKAQSLQAAVVAREHESAERKRVQEELQRVQEFARQVLESNIDCVKILDLDGRLEYMSPPGQRALEIDDFSDFLGRRWVDFWREEDRPRAEAALTAARSGEVGSFQGDCATVLGKMKSWDVKITPALDGQGNIERLIAVSRDITELRNAQTALMEAEKIAATGRLAASIAHEINNPLEAITNVIFIAKTSEDVPLQVRHQLDLADRELMRVAQIAQQTLGFYRDDSRDIWIPVSRLLQELLMIYQRRLDQKRIQTTIDVDAELEFFGKQGELKQTLSNLLANAIDASSPGGRLWLGARLSRDWSNGQKRGVRFTLMDNGSGMPPEVQRRVFLPFFTTKIDRGTGIGLWITKGLIEKNGGFLRFRSRQGAHPGTAMTFFLPQP